MNWSNVAPVILEKVMFYTAQKQERDEEVRERAKILSIEDSSDEEDISSQNTWLLTIEKFCRVSVHWKKVAFSSKILFPSHKTIDYESDSKRSEEEAKILLKAGFLSLVKRLSIDNPEAFQ